MAERTITGGVDTYVSQVTPARTNNGPNVALVQNSTGANSRMLLFLKPPAPVVAGTTILDAKLVLHLRFASHDNITFEAIPVASSWKAGKATWNNQPDLKSSGALSVPATASTTEGTDAATKNVWIEFDISSHMQAVADGASFYGWRIRSDTADRTVTIATSEAKLEWRRPRMVVEYSNAPAPPTDLSPGGGRFISIGKPVLRYTYLDYGGNRDLVAHQVQIDPGDENGDPVTAERWDTGEVPTSEPEMDLSDTDIVDESSSDPYPGLSNGDSARWRVRAKDGAGLWSDWSDWAWFERLSKGSLVINNPAADPNDFVQDMTPPITWTHSGSWAQEAFQVIVQQKFTAGWQNIYNSGKRSGNDDSLTLPRGVLTRANWTSDPQPDDPEWQVQTLYRVVVRTWDGQGRQSTPGDPAYYQATREFTVKEGATVEVENLTVEQDSPYPWAKLTWERDTAPDSFIIIRGGKLIGQPTPDEIDKPNSTTYVWRDKRVTLNRQHTWSVLPVVNNEMGLLEMAVVSETITSNGIWLVNERRAAANSGVLIFGLGGHADVQMSMEDQGEDYEIIGRSNPVRVTNALGGARGSVSGVVTTTDRPALEAYEWRDRLREFKEETGSRLVLITMDYAMPIIAYNISDQPNPVRGVIDVSFDFIQDNRPSYVDD